MNNTRLISFQILENIIVKQAFSNLSLRSELNKIEEAQRGFVTQVVYGTLENFMLVRYAWESYVEKLPQKDTCVLLDMSVYQALCMDNVPDYAIINEAVEIAKRHTKSHQNGLVNAVLRKVIKNGMPPLPEDKKERLSIQTSHPQWLISMWNAQYGEAICTQLCVNNQKARKHSARVNTMKITCEELLRLDPNFSKSEVSEDGVLYALSNIASTSWYQEGFISIQDEASQLVAICLDPQDHEHILDVCSAPGTKACHIAQRMHNTGEILCGDIYEHRVKLIEEGAQRLGLDHLHAVRMDATELSEVKEESFDRVLCDVPCSGYGTLSHKSDIKIRMQSSDMDTLIPLQAKILETSAKKVKVQGILLYSTCTLNKKENEKQIENFLANHSEFTLESEQTIFPFQFQSDGFYMAKLKKISSSIHA